MRRLKIKKAVLLILITTISIILVLLFGDRKISVIALPPPLDVPEEILRTEIIVEARSPIDGKSLTAAEYAQLQAQLKTRLYPPKLDPKVREAVFLLRLRKILKTLFPFVDF